jgi:hypothetical protein
VGPQSWDEYRLLVMQSLDELKVEVREIRKAQELTRQELVALKIRSGLWGGLAGTIPAIVIGVIAWIRMT